MENNKRKGQQILIELLDYLGISCNALADKIGVSYPTLYSIFSGKTKAISESIAIKICKKFSNINFDWIVGRSDIMFVESNGNSDGSPYYTDFTIQGGLGRGDGSEQAIKPSGYMNVPQIKCSPSVAFFQVKGDSMLNIENPRQSIPEGSWIALVPEQTGKIQWGRVYAFETSSGPIVKKLMPSEKDGCIKCVSFNSEEFPQYDLEISDIMDGTFCLVVGCVEVHTF